MWFLLSVTLPVGFAFTVIALVMHAVSVMGGAL